MTKLLVVDDDAPTTDYMRSLLTEAGYSVVALTSANAALAQAKSGERFDLAVLDVVMPELSGDRLAAHLRQLNPDLPILFVTGFNEALFRARPLLWEGESFLEKPFTPAGLVEAVSMAIWGTITPP